MAKFGADPARLTILSGGEGLDDPNWDSNLAKTLKSKFESVMGFILENYNLSQNEKTKFDKLIESKSNRIIKEAKEFLDETSFRSAIQKIFFEYKTRQLYPGPVRRNLEGHPAKSCIG